MHPRPGLLFTHRGVSSFTVATSLARLAVVMVPIALLLSALAFHFTPTDAGALVAVYSVAAAVGGPVAVRLMRRFGDAMVLRISGPVAGVLAILALLALPTPGLSVSVPLAVALGLLTPPVGALARSVLTRLPFEDDARSTAFSLDATISELLYLIGPALVSLLLLLLLVADSAALTAAGCLMIVGTLCTGRSLLLRQYGQPRAATGSTSDHGQPTGAGLRRAPFVCLIAVVALSAAFFGALEIAIAEALVDLGYDSAWAGLVLAAVAVGSVLGGLLYMRRPFPGGTLRRYGLLLVITASTALLPTVLFLLHGFVDSRGVFGALLVTVLVVLGLPVAACGSEEYQLVAEVAADPSTMGAFSVAGSVIVLGLGSFLGGVASSSWPPAAFLLVPLALLVLALLLLWPLRRRLGPAPPSL